MSNESNDGRADAVTHGASAVATTSREEARDVAETAKSQAQDVKGAATEQAQQLGDEAKEHARDVVADLREDLRRRADEQGTRAAQALHDTSSQLRSMARSADGGAVVDLAQNAATRLDDVASRLDRSGIDGLIDDVRSYARRRPGTFLLAAGAAGFLVGRLARNASSAMAGTNQPTTPPAVTAPDVTPPASSTPLSAESDFVGGATPSLTGPPQ
jgi:F0F1-type ATP synthase membrane subunit b/b'